MLKRRWSGLNKTPVTILFYIYTLQHIYNVCVNLNILHERWSTVDFKIKWKRTTLQSLTTCPSPWSEPGDKWRQHAFPGMHLGRAVLYHNNQLFSCEYTRKACISCIIVCVTRLAAVTCLPSRLAIYLSTSRVCRISYKTCTPFGLLPCILVTLTVPKWLDML